MIIRLPKTNKYISTLTNPPRELLVAAGENVAGKMVELWEQGRGGDGVPMKGYSYEYSKKKIKSGRNATVDMNWTGEMTQSMGTKRVTKYSAIVSVSGGRADGKNNLDILRGNVKWRPNLMSEGKETIKAAKSAIVDWLKKNIGGTP
jgi:hypothetical protein